MDNELKVLHISTADIRSGAGRAAYRLHQALKENGVGSLMLVQHKFSDDSDVLNPRNRFIDLKRKINSYINRIAKSRYQIKNKVSFSLGRGPDEILKYIKEINPDIVHFHWINKGYIRLETMTNIQHPIIWTFHDMWSFTGGCHYNQGCEKYQLECGACPVLQSGKQRDLSRKIYLRKKRIYSRIKSLNVISPSTWLANCARKSSLLQNTAINVIPNSIDTKTYKNIDKLTARKALNLPLNKKLIMFGALKVASDPRKGFRFLNDALKRIDNNNVELVVFGSSRPKDYEENRFKAHFLGRVYDEISLALIYSSADVIVVPSIQENLSNMVIESLACGTPVVAFQVGGNPDMIDHKINGYLAIPEDVNDLATGIDWVLNDNTDSDLLSKNARAKVEKTYAPKIVAKQHVDLYMTLFSNSNNE